jgi:hypothetical protein
MSRNDSKLNVSRRDFLGVTVGGGLIAAKADMFAGECIAPIPPPPSADDISATKDDATSEVVLSNNRVRVRFHAGKPKFGVFPKGYTGYTLELKSGEEWTPMADASCFSAYVYRSDEWGRDWLAYVIPEEVRLSNEGISAKVIFSAHHTDLDRVGWYFNFTFTLRLGEPSVEVTYTVTVDQRREFLLFWGPRLHAGQGTFGGTKDEALFPGLEWLGPKERSSAMWAMAPDAQIYMVPDSAKISIPLMTVVKDGRMVGILWEPMQKWNGIDTTPSALFASPNWIEGKEDHLLGLFLPGGPRYVSENGLRAHTPAVIEAGDHVSLRCQLFASPASHAVDAVDLYLRTRGGLPPVASTPMEYGVALEMLVRALTTTAWNAKKKGWQEVILPSGESLDESHVHPSPQTIVALAAAARMVSDHELAQRARDVVQEALSAQSARPLSLALRVGGVAAALRAERATATGRIHTQQSDGSWVYTPSVAGEEGLAFLKGPPEPGTIGYAGQRDEGLTAGQVSALLEYVLVSGDDYALQAALRGFRELDRYVIPFGYSMDMGEECPHSPSLHGSYLGLRSYLLAYRMTGEQRFLERAVYWAKTGLPFLYLWSLPEQEVKHGHIAMNIRLRGDQLYRNTRRDPMLYGALYGYGSSQFSHHWYGLLVQWIGLVYAGDLMALAEYDQTLAWKQIVDGILASALWLTYDQAPYTGYYPDAFNLVQWVPSGPAIAPGAMLEALLIGHYGVSLDPRTVILQEGAARYHLTSAARIGNAKLDRRAISFTVDDASWDDCRIVIAGLRGEPMITADGQSLPKVGDLEQMDENWSQAERGELLVKVKQIGHPRRIVINLM